MSRLHLARNLRSLAFLLGLAAILAALGILGWANHTGLPAAWRAIIELEVAKQGAHIKIGSLRYLPFHGVVATDLQVFSNSQHSQEISRLESVTLDFDKTKLARGLVHLNKVQLNDARLILPVDPNDPKSEVLNVTDANGTLLMPGNRRLEVRDAHGKIAGIDVTLNARLIGYQKEGDGNPNETSEGKRRELLAQVINELEKWKFDEDRPPAIQISIEGSINDPSSIAAKIGLQVREMEKNGHVLEEISAAADLNGDLLTITQLRATDSRGTLEAWADYDIRTREGRFDVHSSLEIPQLLKAWLGLPPLSDILIGGKQTLEAQGDFSIDERNAAHIRLTGHARCESVMLRGMSFDAVESMFSWHNGDLFLRDLLLLRPDGLAKGKALIEWPLVRLELNSTLPVPVYRPFFKKQPLEIVLNDFSERKGAHVEVNLEGGFNLTDRHAWAYTGNGALKNLNYKGVPLNSANCKFTLNHHELDFYEGKIEFNYDDYPLRKAFSGKRQGQAQVGRIRYDAPSKTVSVESVSGDIWAAPMVRLFAPKIADSLEQYRFHQPPTLNAAGIVDVTPQGRTSLDISFLSDQAADYKFLGEDLTLSKPSGKVSIRGPVVSVSNLSVTSFDGPISARFENSNGKLNGEMSWTKLSIPSLTSSYGFRMKGGGSVTGRIDFALDHGKVETMSGKGLLALEDAELFTVPMFGPLTPLISGVLNDKTVGIQTASNAFCTFDIQDGILSTKDFQTATKSLNFAGDGSVNLKERSVDMTLRMNARGLLRLIALPLRSFSGLFQFHGTGPIQSPDWENMKFTHPEESQSDFLLEPPKAKIIPPKSQRF
jgi:hypothetical protein